MRISDWSSDVCSSDLIKKTITNVLGLWLNPLVDAATAASDFDLRQLRQRPMSIYLGVSPDELDRIAPLYNLLFQQLIDLNVRELPDENRSEEHTSELQSLMRISYAVFCLKKKKQNETT